jgi:hypothetical protein
MEHVQVRVVLSRGAGGSSVNVKNDVEALPRIFNSGHVIIILTHKAILSADTSGFGEWRLVIDETPSIIREQALTTPVSAEWLENHFDLLPAGPGWSVPKLKTKLARRLIEQDDFLRPALAFYDACTSSTMRVVCDVTDWSHTATDRSSWTWHSIWGAELLGPFETVTILGNNFETSVLHDRLLAAGVQLIPVPVDGRTPHKPRKMKIRYFARMHYASATLFNREQGQRYLAEIGRYFVEQNHRDAIWTANGRYRDVIGYIPGSYLSPRQAGSNRFQDRHVAIAIYTAKPGPATVKLCEQNGIPADVITTEREREPIVQFIMRTSVRDPQSTADVTAYVYDRETAEYVAARLGSMSYLEIEMECIDLGFADDAVRRLPARIALTPAEQEAAAAALREKRRLAKSAQRAAARAINPPRSRGRPPKMAA